MTTSYEAFCWMTTQADRTEHAVTDDAQATGIEAGAGWYEPLCGSKFLVACMDVGPLSRCSRCALLVHARGSLRAFNERLTEYRRPGWLNRLMCRYQQPADVGSETTLPDSHAPTSAGLHLSEDAMSSVGELTTALGSTDTDAHHRQRGRHAA